MDNRYQVFVSSTYVDLKEERQIAIQTLMKMKCIPAGMELFPAADEQQWNFIQKIIDDCDYYLLIVGGRYGSLTDEGISYTEKEFDYAVSKGIRVVAFIHGTPEELPYKKSEMEPQLREKLEAFKEKICTGRLVEFWTEPQTLGGAIALSMINMITTYPAVGWVRGNIQSSVESLTEIVDLRKENEKLRGELGELKKSSDVVIDDIAGMESKHIIGGYYYRIPQDKLMGRRSNWNITMSWDELFKYISPLLEQHPNNGQLNKILADILIKYKEEQFVEASINEICFNTICIQFKALGLIASEYAETVKGGRALFWSLTPKGYAKMMNSMVIKDQIKDVE